MAGAAVPSADGRRVMKAGWRNTVAAALALLAAGNTQAATAARQPLGMPDAKEFYQRIITLPGAALRRDPSGESVISAALPVFSIFYVFGRQTTAGKEWVEVGRNLNGPAEGWLSGDKVEDWTTMLVMQYAPAGQRGRVLYFERQEDLSDVVQAVDAGPIVAGLMAEADSGKTTEPRLVAIEPKVERGTPTFDNKPYLMPISRYQQSSFDDGRPATLLEIASLNADPPTVAPAVVTRPMKIGIVVVVDTSISMQPYIERALQTIEIVYKKLQQDGVLDRAAFGLVGYRNNMDAEPQRSRLEYVVKTYQHLDPRAPVDTILGNMRLMREAKISTHSFNEDAVAGLHTAIEEMDWTPFDARLIIFVTDAGALSGNDPKAKFRDVDIINIKEAADRKKIAIFPIHLLSGEAAKANNIEGARRQYIELGGTGDKNASKYIAVKGADVDEFQRKMQQLSLEITQAVRTIAGNERLEPVEIPTADPATADLGKLLLNELFNAQMRYIGGVQGTQAPLFFKAWAADKDLVRRNLQVLDVSVFLSRNQLSQLALSLRRIVDQAKVASIDQSSFFSLLRSLAASTIQDPSRYRGNFATIADSNLLPAFLSNIPYKSEVLQMSEDRWKSLSKTQVEELIDRIMFKLRAYQDIYEDTKNWRDLGAGDPGQAVSAIPLEILP